MIIIAGGGGGGGDEPEQAAHWLTNLSLHKAGFVAHK